MDYRNKNFYLICRDNFIDINIIGGQRILTPYNNFNIRILPDFSSIAIFFKNNEILLNFNNCLNSTDTINSPDVLEFVKVITDFFIGNQIKRTGDKFLKFKSGWENNKNVENFNYRYKTFEIEAFTDKVFNSITEVSPGLTEGKFFNFSSNNTQVLISSTSPDDIDTNLSTNLLLSSSYFADSGNTLKENNLLHISNANFPREPAIFENLGYFRPDKFYVRKGINNVAGLNDNLNKGDIYYYISPTSFTNNVFNGDYGGVKAIIPADRGINSRSSIHFLTSDIININDININSNIKNTDTIIRIALLSRYGSYGSTNVRVPYIKEMEFYLSYYNKNIIVNLSSYKLHNIPKDFIYVNETKPLNPIVDIVVVSNIVSGVETDIDLEVNITGVSILPIKEFLELSYFDFQHK